MAEPQRCKTCAFWKRKPDLLTFQHTSVPDAEGAQHVYCTSVWEDKERTLLPEEGWVTELKKRQPADLGTCASPKLVYTGSGGDAGEDMALIPPNGIGYSDNEALAAYVLTGEDFGCVNWLNWLECSFRLRGPSD